MEDMVSMTAVTENAPVLIALAMDWGMRILGALLIMIGGWIVGKWVSKRIRGLNRLDATLSGFLAGFAKYAVLAVAIVAVLGQFGVQTASLLAVLGAAGLAIGLALQGTLSNVAAGTMLLILRPFHVGDYVEANGIGGTVKTLGLFGSEFATPDNVYIYVPNSKIWNNEIKNYTRNNTRRQDITFGIGYDDDISKALSVITSLLENEERVLKAPKDKAPAVMTEAMGDSSVNLIARFWCKKGDYWDLRWDMTKAIKEELDKHEISIPYPTRTIEMAGAGAETEKSKQAA